MKLNEKVIYCLDKYPETRNSDILLTRAVWYEFHNSKIFKDEKGFPSIKLESLMDLPREDHIKRLRAKLNSDGKFMPTNQKVLKQRKLLEKTWRIEMAINNPSRG